MCVLYLPKDALGNFMNHDDDQKNEMKLCVKKVLISNSFELSPSFSWILEVINRIRCDNIDAYYNDNYDKE